MLRREKGRLIVISGPSGTGKGTVIALLMGLRDDLCLSVSLTTRAPRPGEVDGRDYFFVSREEFERRVEQKLEEGVSVILEIDVQGAEQVLSSCPDSVSVFILPPSGTELERRLRGRHTDSEEKIRSRLLAAKRECAEAGKYGYIVVNDSAQEINAIITAEKCKSAYRTNLVTEVLIS